MMVSGKSFIALTLSPAALALSSCEAIGTVESSAETQSVASASSSETVGPFNVTEHGTFNEPWSAAFEPGSGRLFITEKSGQLKLFNPQSGAVALVKGEPEVDYGGQGGFGDIAFAPDYETSKMVYLSWVESGENDTRGAVVGRGTLSCAGETECAVEALTIVWRQSPKVTGRGHYSHRIIFSPDGLHMFVASGDRQKMQPAQDNSNNLGTIVRLNLDGTPAAGNPMADRPPPSNEIWSFGHRNILGMGFDAQGKLWDVEHGPAGGDELNMVIAGANYGWPVVSDGNHYGGEEIPKNATRPDLAQSSITWTPVIAPGGMIFYRGAMFDGWKGSALIAGLSSKTLVHVKIDGESASEIGRYQFDNRLRAVVEADDGAIWVLEDGDKGRLLRLTPS